MKKYLMSVLIVLGWAASAHAVEFILEGINHEKWIQENIKVDLSRSLGDITLERLIAKYGQDSGRFEADESGIAEIGGLRTVFQPLNGGSQRLFGWCFEVNGVNLDSLADEVFLTSQKDRVRWYYGSISREAGGTWDTVCVPVERRAMN